MSARHAPGAATMLVAAALLGVVALAWFWPGVAHSDTITQYRQVLGGAFSDWHPPVMARLWALFHAAGWSGQAPMFAIQTILYWAGLGLVAAAVARAGHRVAALAVLALGAWPPLAGWQAVVVKDAQMAAALVAATGLVAWRRLGDKPITLWVAGPVLLLMAYALLLRANAAFAVAPLAVGLLTRWRWQDWRIRFAMIAAVGIAALTLSPAINQGPLGAKASGAEASLVIFDLAGIAHRAGPQAVPLIDPILWRELEAKRCHSSILWDIFSTGLRCDFIQRTMVGRPREDIFGAWRTAIVEHPMAYASHRIAHWNATMRWLVPWHLPQAVPQARSLSNDVGLASPGPWVGRYAAAAGWLANSPLGAPMLAFVAALAVLGLARPGLHAAHAVAVPLALSAVAMEASLLVVSVAGDLRYHLWSIVAAGLAAILLLCAPVSRRGARIALVLLSVVAASGMVARVTLPPVGGDYDALIR